jgi:hypothetical protein
MATVTISQVTDTLEQQLTLSAPINGGSPTGSLKQPDIEYHPDRVKWQVRTARRLEADPTAPATALPDGFPNKLDSPLVWEGKDWKDEKEWMYELKASEIKEIDDAVKRFRGEWLCINRLTLNL